ncbi:protein DETOXIFICATION 45, chloroplastic-like [Solanum lycopersicum]|uniref:protein DETOXIFICATION 45, chloroplastic-like n=1 Tax=Solanum lycopersicum TaxID=4081 RepID=UPI0002767EB5|nr:protein DETOXIFICATION 45, chloroplastic-like [Solanum lycopersicum]XP_010317254.1 protein DETOXIFICATION 45, chloroplastic-like [Solanum lycopersicum]
MAVLKLPVAVTCGRTNGTECAARRTLNKPFLVNSSTWNNYLGSTSTKRSKLNNVIRNCGLSTDGKAVDYNLDSSNLEEKFGDRLSNEGAIALSGTSIDQSPTQDVQTELIVLCLPAIAGQAIEPLAQLMETAYIGRMGALELASAGISVSIFNIISKVFNIPLLSVATSFVAEDISKYADEDNTAAERKALPSVSTALVLSAGIGLIEAAAMYLGSGPFLSIMGLSTDSTMRIPAEHFLKLRALGAPAVVLYLAVQGIFRGFKDTRTPVMCLGLGNLSAVLFFPIFMYTFQLGITGAAISTVASQYIVAILMLWKLNEKTVLLQPNIRNLHFGGYLKSGGFLLGRTLAAVLTVTLSTSMAARLGAIPMAAHQICLQVWLSASLLADAQAASGQALIASSFARKDYGRVKLITHVALKTGLATGILLAIILGLSFPSFARCFTNDSQVLDIVRSGLLFVSASQPLNALAYIFDGLHYGVSDFPYAAISMMIVGALASIFLIYAPPIIGLPGVWSGLTIFMGLRSVAGFMRLSAKNGPWWFLQDSQENEVASS